MADDATARLALPMLAPGQAQKELFHNEALARIDIALHASVAAAGVNVPPADPVPGACWIVGDAPEGDWQGHAGALAGWTGGGWRFVAPCEGMRAWVVAARAFALHADGHWTIGENRDYLMVDGEQVVGPRQPAIADPQGGGTIDSECRATVAAILASLRIHGLIYTA